MPCAARPHLPLLLAAALAALPACHLLRNVPYLGGEPLPPPAAFRDGSLDFGGVQRILALPLHDESGAGAAVDVVSATLSEEIMRLGRFGVVRPDASDAQLRPPENPLSSGRIPVASLIDLGRRYGVDAVLFGTVSHYRPYPPPVLGLSLSLVDVQTGKIIWSVSDFLDAGDRRCAVSMQWFYEDEAARGESVYGSEIVGTSPRWFARFASRRVVGTM